MAFDPDAFVGGRSTAAPGRGAFDPDTFIGIEPPPRKEVGTGESILRGVRSGVTFGFGDELAGAIDMVMSGGKKPYAQGRDEARAADAAARQDHPYAFGASEIGAGIATSFIPGLGIARGATLGASALKAGALGAAGGLGASEREDLGGQLSDAAKSGVLSGVASGVLGKVVRGAPERVEKRLIGNITDGATATQRDRVVGRAGSRVGEVLEAIKGDKAIKAAKGDPHQLLPAIEDALDRTGAKLDDVYARAGAATPGIKVSEILGTVEGIATRLSSDPGKRPLAAAVMSTADDILQTWGSRTHVTAQEVRVLAKDIADTAFRGSPAIGPKQGAAVGRQVWGELKDLITENIDVSAKTLGKGGAAELQALNRRMSTLTELRGAVAYRATRESTTPTTLRSRISGGIDVALALADPTTFVAKKAYDFVGRPALHSADAALAELVVAARNGSTPARIAQLGVELGLGRATGEAVAQWATKKFGGADASETPP